MQCNEMQQSGTLFARGGERFLRESSELRCPLAATTLQYRRLPSRKARQETQVKETIRGRQRARHGEGWKIAAIVESCGSCGPTSQQRYTVARLGMKINRGGARIIPLSLRAHCTGARPWPRGGSLASLNRLMRSSLSIAPPLRVSPETERHNVKAVISRVRVLSPSERGDNEASLIHRALRSLSFPCPSPSAFSSFFFPRANVGWRNVGSKGPRPRHVPY